MTLPTRQRLIDTAFELFAQHGFNAVGLDRILAEVGVTKTTFYNHFQSKDDLIIAVLQDQHAKEMESIRKTLRDMGGPTPAGQLRSIFDLLDVWFNDGSFRGCIFISAAVEFPSAFDPVHQAAAVHKRAVLDLLHDLAMASGAEEPTALAEQLAVLVEGAIVLRHMTENGRVARIAGETAQLLLDRYLPDGAAAPAASASKPASA